MKIKSVYWLAIFLFSFYTNIHAITTFTRLKSITTQNKALENSPLLIATAQFSPPFVLRGGHKQLYGFDIAVMTALCKRMNRACLFTPVSDDQLIDNVFTQKADLAIGGITIGEKNHKMISFSEPYLPSESRFIALSTLADKPFSFSLLANKKIGVVSGSIFNDQIKRLPIDHPTIITFSRDNNMIEALASKNIDVGFLDNGPAIYWQNRSAERIKAFGKPMRMGSSYGIALSRTKTKLLRALNAALLDYQKSDEFKQDYQVYIANF